MLKDIQTHSHAHTHARTHTMNPSAQVQTGGNNPPLHVSLVCVLSSTFHSPLSPPPPHNFTHTHLTSFSPPPTHTSYTTNAIRWLEGGGNLSRKEGGGILSKLYSLDTNDSFSHSLSLSVSLFLSSLLQKIQFCLSLSLSHSLSHKCVEFVEISQSCVPLTPFRAFCTHIRTNTHAPPFPPPPITGG